MLKKLLKYDLQNIFKFLMIFYSLALLFATLTRVFFMIENSLVVNVLGQVCCGVTISMIFNILINNLMRLWVRFKNNLYGDESYLTHTLPINKETLYLSKIITAIISLFISTLVIGGTLFIAFYSKDNITLIKNMLLPLANIYNSSIVRICMAFLFIFFIEFVNALQAGYTGIIIGNMMNNSRTGFSVLFGFIAYIVTQLMVLIIIYVVALFNSDIMNLFYTTEAIDMKVLKMVIYLAIIVYIVVLIIGYFVNIKLFNKGINVE